MAFGTTGVGANTAFSKTAGTTLATSLGAGSYAVGTLLVMFFAMDNTSTTSGATSTLASNAVSDPQGNTWTKQWEYTNAPSGAASGVTLACYTCIVSTSIGATDNITVTHPSVTARCYAIYNYSIGAGSTVSVDGSPVQTTGSTTPNAAQTVSSLSNVEHLAFDVFGQEDPAASASTETSWTAMSAVGTTGGSGTTNIWQAGVYRIVAASTSISSTPTQASSGDYQRAVFALKEVVSGGATVAPSAGHLTFGGKVPSLTLALNPATGHLAFGGKVPTVSVGTSITPFAGHLAFTGYQTAITRTTAVAPSVAHLTSGGKVPSVSLTTKLSPSTGHLTFGGKVSSVIVGTSVSPLTGHLTFAGHTPALTFATALSPTTGHLTFGGKASSVTRISNLTPTPGHLALGGKASSLSLGIAPATGHLVFTGYVPDVSGTTVPSTSQPLKVMYRHRGRNA